MCTSIPKAINPRHGKHCCSMWLEDGAFPLSQMSWEPERCQRHSKHMALEESYPLSLEGALELLSSVLPSAMAIRPHNGPGSGTPLIPIWHLEAGPSSTVNSGMQRRMRRPPGTSPPTKI